MRKWIVAGGIATSLVLAAPALAGGPPVAGKSFRAVGTTVTKVSFREIQREPGQINIYFDEGTFDAVAVHGTYRQRRRRIRLRADEALLREREVLWAEDFADHLRGDGNAVDRVVCRNTKAKLRGRSRKDSLRLRTKYKFRCKASGDFGTRRARVQVRFKGRGELLVLNPADFADFIFILPPRSGPPQLGGVIIGLVLPPSRPLPEGGLHTISLPAIEFPEP